MFPSTEDQLKHQTINTHVGSISTTPAVISSLINSIPAINGSPRLSSEQLISANPNAISLNGALNDCAYSVDASRKAYHLKSMNTGEANTYDFPQAPIMSIPQYPVDFPKLALHKGHLIESNIAREELPYKMNSSLLPQTKNASNRYSTGSLTPKRFTSFPSVTRLRPTDNSLRSVKMTSPEDALHLQATIFESRNFKRRCSVSEENDSIHRYPCDSSPAESNRFSYNTVYTDKFELPAHLRKACETEPEHGDIILDLNCILKADDGRKKISADAVPDRKSSLRNQRLSTEEPQLHKSCLIRTRVEHETYSISPTDLLGSGKNICHSCVSIDFDDKIGERFSHLKKLKKQRSSDYVYHSMKDQSSNQNIQTQRKSSQTLIVAEDKDRIIKAYKHLGLPGADFEQSKDFSNTTGRANDTSNLITPIGNISESADIACDLFSLNKAFGAIESTPNLSLDILQFDAVNVEEEIPLVLKRKSTRRPFRSHQREDKGRKKLSPTDFDRSDSSRSKRASYLTMESLTSLTRRPQHQSADNVIEQNIKSFLAAQRLSQIVTHPRSGRKISFSEVGDPNGNAVLCCVGMGLTRFVTVFYDDLARTLHLRLITPDRPGIGNSEKDQDDDGMPLNWSEDVCAICSHLRIKKFSILAHSAGAIYALATALRVPQYVEGRIHLLAPWITPSQMKEAGTSIGTFTGGQLPRSQRILKALPARLLKVANASFMSATSSSVTRTTSNSAQYLRSQGSRSSHFATCSLPLLNDDGGYRKNTLHMDRINFNEFDGSSPPSADRSTLRNSEADMKYQNFSGNRQSEFDVRLTLAIWDAATSNANPAVDLLVCLERYKTIGFQYTDVDLPVVILHGSQDTRVPVENAKWLGGMMRNCETRILDDEGHGLMASATTMGEVLTDVAKNSQK